MKIILTTLLVLFCTSVFAAEDVLICYNPVHFNEDEYKGSEIESVIMDRDSTTVELKDGRVRKYTDPMLLRN